MLIRQTQIVHLNIIYYRPDYSHLLQEFVWSYDDVIPELQKTHRFLLHWKNNIDAVVKEILLGIHNHSYHSYRSVDDILNIN